MTVAIIVLFGTRFTALGWCLLIAAVICWAMEFIPWRRVAPHLANAGRWTWGWVKNNKTLTLIITLATFVLACFVIGLLGESQKAWRIGLALLPVVVVLIVGFTVGKEPFLEYWAAWWLGLSIWYGLWCFVFDKPWGWALISAILALLVLTGWWKVVLTTCGKCLAFQAGETTRIRMLTGLLGWLAFSSLVGFLFAVNGHLDRRIKIGPITTTQGDLATGLAAVAVGLFVLLVFFAGSIFVEAYVEHGKNADRRRAQEERQRRRQQRQQGA